MMINRKLLIISNGGVNKDLQGYDIDIANYQRFFSKPEAGYWDFGDNGDAILCETNMVNCNTLLDYIKSENSKGPIYWVIVFVGHGYADSHGVDYLELCPEELDKDSSCAIKDIKAAIGSKSSCLLITDCCRAIPSYESGVAIRRVQMFCAAQKAGEKVVELTMQLADCRKTLLAVRARIETLQEAADIANATRQEVIDMIASTTAK